MVYKKIMITCFVIAITMICLSTVVFATTDIGKTDDKIYTGVMDILLNIQKYSWPVAIIVLVYAMYKYYVIGSEAFEQKVSGQKMIVGVSIFMAIIQTLPLIYAFVIVR